MMVLHSRVRGFKNRNMTLRREAPKSPKHMQRKRTKKNFQHRRKATAPIDCDDVTGRTMTQNFETFFYFFSYPFSG